jgi:hypothetical protein
MRICGRLLRPSNLAEQRAMNTLGLANPFRVPRSQNPFAIARKLRRLAALDTPDGQLLRRLAARQKNNIGPKPLPDSTSEPVDVEHAA